VVSIYGAIFLQTNILFSPDPAIFFHKEVTYQVRYIQFFPIFAKKKKIYCLNSEMSVFFFSWIVIPYIRVDIE
jgi:hypothetical protein